MNIKKALILAILILIPCLTFAGPLFCPGFGVDVDIAVNVEPIWFGTVNMPVMWMNQNILGFSLVPSFSFGATGIQGYLAAEGMLVFSVSKEKPYILLFHTGVGLGAYKHEGQAEFLPVFTCGVSMFLDRFYIRAVASLLVMTKYYRNVDTYASITFGYGFGNRDR